MPGRPYSPSVTRIRVTNSETPAWTRSDSAALGSDRCHLARGTAAAGRHLQAALGLLPAELPVASELAGSQGATPACCGLSKVRKRAADGIRTHDLLHGKQTL